jgi:integrase
VRDYRNHSRTYILSRIGEVELADFSLEHLEDLRLRLQADHGLGLKTIRNVIDGSLRAMFRDARKAGIDVGFPFADLEWPRRVAPGPDPFTEEERARLLEYFLHKRWRTGRHQGRYEARPHFPYYAFLFSLFYTGMRPSEAVALRVKSLDLASGTLFVERSRSLGAEAAPKTAAAARVVRLTPRNIEVLDQLIELRAEPIDLRVQEYAWRTDRPAQLLQTFLRRSENAWHAHERSLCDKGHLRLYRADPRRQPCLAFRANRSR